MPKYLLTADCGCNRMTRADKELEAGIAQLVEYKLPKLGVAGSNPVARSICWHKTERGLKPFLRLPAGSGCGRVYFELRIWRRLFILL